MVKPARPPEVPLRLGRRLTNNTTLIKMKSLHRPWGGPSRRHGTLLSPGSPSIAAAMVQNRLHRILTPLATPRSWLLVAAHALVFAAAYWLAFALRFDFDITAEGDGPLLEQLGLGGRIAVGDLRPAGRLPRLVALCDLRRSDRTAPRFRTIPVLCWQPSTSSAQLSHPAVGHHPGLHS